MLEIRKDPAPPGIPASLVWSGATRNLLPLLRFCTSSGLSPCESCRTHLYANASLRDFTTVQRIRSCESTIPEVPNSGLRSGFRFSQPFAGLLLTSLADLFHPANALRLFPPGISPSKEPPRLFAETFTVVPFVRGCAPTILVWWDRRRTFQSTPRGGVGAFLRLHGVAPLGSPCLWPICLGPATSRAPPGFSPLQGLPDQNDAVAHHHRSSHAPPSRLLL